MRTSTTRLHNCVDAKLFVIDGTDYDPQTLAMLQAFYSRSTKSIGDRVEGLNAEQVRESLHKFYIGYGHRSIGQCANFSVFLEDVSIFAAKAIQHHPLYNGQETSTRYYDFSERPMILPDRSDLFESEMRQLYSNVLAHATEAYLRIAHETHDKVTDTIERAARAQAFDLARSVLTCGYTTKLSWTTNFDQSAEQLAYLINSPVPELNRIGMEVGKLLHEHYPQAVEKPATLINAWQAECLSRSFFDDTHHLMHRSSEGDDLAFNYRFNQVVGMPYSVGELMKLRKRGQAVPRNYAKYGTFDFNFNVDYGSFRDLHRHRNGVMYFPSYAGELRMHPWYIEEMKRIGIADKPGLYGGSRDMSVLGALHYVYTTLIPMVFEKSFGVNLRDVLELGYANHGLRAALMYYVPLGTMVRAHMRFDLPQAIYVAETRSARTVHATARIPAVHMAEAVEKMLHAKLVHVDNHQGFAAKRGEQTILERK